MIDTKEGHLPQKGLWRGLDRVLSFTCAGNPSQKYLWGILGAQVIDTKGKFSSLRWGRSDFFDRDGE